MDVFADHGTELRAGAVLQVILVDGVGRRTLYELKNIVDPPDELLLARPANVPALLTKRDPAFLYFTRCEFLEDDKPVYHMVTRDDHGQAVD